MKRNAIIRIIIWSIVIVILLAIMVTFIAYDLLSTNRFTGSSWAETQPVSSQGAITTELIQYADASQIQEIEIEWVAGSITLQPGDVESIEFVETDLYDSNELMVWRQSGNTLSIQFCKDSISFSGFSINGNISKDLVITVPRDWICRSLEIDAAAANVDVTDLTIHEVEFDCASGTCDFTNCNIDSLDMDTASGDVTIDGTLDTLDFDGASAGIYATLTNIPSRIDIDTMSGDLELTLPENAGFTVSMDAMSSDFDSDFEVTLRNGNYVCGDGRCRIFVNAMSGDVYIRQWDVPDSEAVTTPSEIKP